MSTEQIWDLERSFWLDGVPTYQANLHEKAAMTLPGVGILDRLAIIESIRQAPRWNEVQMTGRRTITEDGTTVLAYAAEATREGAAVYSANCISTYVRRKVGACSVTSRPQYSQSCYRIIERVRSLSPSQQ